MRFYLNKSSADEVRELAARRKQHKLQRVALQFLVKISFAKTAYRARLMKYMKPAGYEGYILPQESGTFADLELGMTLKLASKGKYGCRKFCGCKAFPACRGLAKLEQNE